MGAAFSPVIAPASGAEILRFIDHPFRASQGTIVTGGEVFGVASDSCTDRASKKEELFYVCTVVDARMAIWTKTTSSK